MKYPSGSIRWFAEFNILQLKHVATHGIDPVYANFREFLFDFWPDLPWNEDSIEVIDLILSDIRFKKFIYPEIKKKYRFDMKRDLIEGRNEMIDEMEE